MFRYVIQITAGFYPQFLHSVVFISEAGYRAVVSASSQIQTTLKLFRTLPSCWIYYIQASVCVCVCVCVQ